MGEQLIVTLVRTWVIDLWNIFWWNIDKTGKIVCFLWKKNAPQGRQNHRMQQQICKKCKKILFFGQKTLYWGTQKNPLLRFWIFFRRRGDVTQSEESIAHALTYFADIKIVRRSSEIGPSEIWQSVHEILMVSLRIHSSRFQTFLLEKVTRMSLMDRSRRLFGVR